MTRAEALDVLQRCARESTEAMRVIQATHPLRPMGCEEAEAKRSEEGPRSSDGRATGFYPEGRGFDSSPGALWYCTICGQPLNETHGLCGGTASYDSSGKPLIYGNTLPPDAPSGLHVTVAKLAELLHGTAPQDGEPGTGLTGVDPENSAPPLAKPNALAPALIPADCDATRALAVMRAPAGDAVRMTLDYFATLHPLAVARRRFEYHRKGCELVEVVTRCLHWWSAVGERVTVLDAAQVEGTCPYCAFSDHCDCEAGRRMLYLFAGAEFVDVKHLGGEPSQAFYWRLLPIAATEE